MEPEDIPVKLAARKATEIVTIGASLYFELALSALRLLRGGVEEPQLGG